MIMNFIVLSSTRGTVFQAVIDRISDGSLHAKCLGLVSDNEKNGCVAKAVAGKIPVKIVERKEKESREEYDKRLHQAILDLGGIVPSPKSQVQSPFVACMGWMYLLSPWFVKEWSNRILNVHPALLPKYPGTHSHELVLKNKDIESGMTIHLIDEGMDTGKILLQKKCPVLPEDTEESLQVRVQQLEKEWYPKVLGMIEEGTLKM